MTIVNEAAQLFLGREGKGGKSLVKSGENL